MAGTLIATNITLNTRNFMAAHKLLHRYSTTVPGEALAKAVGFVVKDAKDNTPFTSIGRIDSELSVLTTPVLSTRGARKGLPLKSGRSNVEVISGDTPETAFSSLAMKVVLARLNPFSNYNILTDRKYALNRKWFSAGQGTAGFIQKVQETAERMARSRHSSTHFLQTSWNAILQALIPLVPANYRGYFSRIGGRVTPEMGSVLMKGSSKVTLVIENKVGMDPQYPTISAIRNMEAHRILTPVLQQAIDRNFIKQMEIAAKRGLTDISPQLKAMGVNVN